MDGIQNANRLGQPPLLYHGGCFLHALEVTGSLPAGRAVAVYESRKQGKLRGHEVEGLRASDAAHGTQPAVPYKAGHWAGRSMENDFGSERDGASVHTASELGHTTETRDYW